MLSNFLIHISSVVVVSGIASILGILIQRYKSKEILVKLESKNKTLEFKTTEGKRISYDIKIKSDELDIPKIGIILYESNMEILTRLLAILKGGSQFDIKGIIHTYNNMVDEINKYMPDIVIADTDIPGADKLLALNAIREQSKHFKILLISDYETEDVIYRDLQYNADGYLCKSDLNAAFLINSITKSYKGDIPMSPSVASKTLNLFKKSSFSQKFELTDREINILDLMVKGYSYKMIGKKLNMSISTIMNYKKNIYVKLNVHSPIEAAAIAIKMRLIK